MTFVRTRLALDAITAGQTLLVLLVGAEPQARVPKTVRELGHRVVSAQLDDAGTMLLWVQKRGDLVAPGATG